jgi:hypothetical protein
MPTLSLYCCLGLLFLWMPLLTQAQIDSNLQLALALNNTRAVEIALSKGANLNATDSLGARSHPSDVGLL